MPALFKNNFFTGSNAYFLFFIAIILIFSGCSVVKPDMERENAIREKVVSTAMKYKGCPYKYGGTTPKGFDCSGFTSYVYKKAGIKLPRSSDDQYDAGSDIDFDEMQNGDLVFFTRWSGVGKLFSPNHVGIFIGNGRFIHAPSSGGRVRIDRLSDSYWENHYKGSRKVIE